MSTHFETQPARDAVLTLKQRLPTVKTLYRRCNNVYGMMRPCVPFFPEYTLHDEQHPRIHYILQLKDDDDITANSKQRRARTI